MLVSVVDKLDQLLCCKCLIKDLPPGYHTTWLGICCQSCTTESIQASKLFF